MKALVLGDVHLRTKTPEGRTESDFLDLQLDKLKQVFDLAVEEKCDCIIQPGDFWDRPDPPKHSISKCILLLKQYTIPLFVIAGQHDMIGHSESSIKNSAIALMQAADVCYILDKSPHTIADYNLYGASFGQDIPVPDEDNNILVIHAMITSIPIFPGQEVISPNLFMKKNKKYDLIVCGDYHYRFNGGLGNRRIVNAGCMTRLKRSEQELKHKPGVFIYESETSNIEEVLLKVNPPSKAFSPKKGKESSDLEGLEELIDKLKSQGKLGVSFRDNLLEYFKVHETSTKIKDVISNTMEELGG